MVREVNEEAGVQCEIIDLISTADLITPDESGRIEFHYVVNHYLARALTETTTSETPEAEVGSIQMNFLMIWLVYG